MKSIPYQIVSTGKALIICSKSGTESQCINGSWILGGATTKKERLLIVSKSTYLQFMFTKIPRITCVYARVFLFETE